MLLHGDLRTVAAEQRGLRLRDHLLALLDVGAGLVALASDVREAGVVGRAQLSDQRGGGAGFVRHGILPQGELGI